MPSFRPLLRHAAAALAAAALVLPALAAPAEAGPRNRDVFNFIAGATTAVILLKALEGHHAHAAPRPLPYPHPHPARPAHLYLPGHCAQSYPAPAGHDVVYLHGCLERAGYRWALPRHCAFEVMTDRGWRRAYSGNCLCDAGYVVASARR